MVQEVNGEVYRIPFGANAKGGTLVPLSRLAKREGGIWCPSPVWPKREGGIRRYTSGSGGLRIHQVLLLGPVSARTAKLRGERAFLGLEPMMFLQGDHAPSGNPSQGGWVWLWRGSYTRSTQESQSRVWGGVDPIFWPPGHRCAVSPRRVHPPAWAAAAPHRPPVVQSLEKLGATTRQCPLCRRSLTAMTTATNERRAMHLSFAPPGMRYLLCPARSDSPPFGTLAEGPQNFLTAKQDKPGPSPQHNTPHRDDTKHGKHSITTCFVPTPPPDLSLA
jgi:hypothetical protein